MALRHANGDAITSVLSVLLMWHQPGTGELDERSEGTRQGNVLARCARLVPGSARSSANATNRGAIRLA